MQFSISDIAALRIEQQLVKRGQGEGIRIAVKPSGCSGMAYSLEFADSVLDTDSVFQHNNAKVIIDDKSLVYLSGSVLDFVKEGLNQGFKIHNPNVKAECGCGESFSV